ncbi:hypothetical protein CHS0354_026172 [Potamilus streckersoni]|uniref:Uncharacterized protein n=1 Tax=Potamilus streckersoni TaxID=2493646 RepID=A0AAE0SB55_9BIVA|nr:hypothetical protein CHS0354_026172 [Potamilus streckersoni]
MPLQFRKQRMFQRGGPLIFRKSVTELSTLKDKVHPAEKSVSSESTRLQYRECSDDKTHRCDEPDLCYPSSDRKIFACQNNTMGKSGRVIEVSDLSQKNKCIDNSKKHGQNVESSIIENINVVEGESEALEQQKMDDRSPGSHAMVVQAETGELGTRVLTQTHQAYRKSPRFRRRPRPSVEPCSADLTETHQPYRKSPRFQRRPPRFSVEPCSGVLTQTHQPNIKPPRFQRRPSRLSGNVSHLDENREREKSFPIKGSCWSHQFANSEQTSCHGTSYFYCRSDVTKRDRQQSSSNSYGSAEVDTNHCAKIACNNYRPSCNTKLEDWSLDLIDLSQSNVFNKASMEGQMTVQELQPVPSSDSGIGKSLLDSSTYRSSFVENWDLECVPVTATTQDSVPVVMDTLEGIPVMSTGKNTTITVNTSPEQKEDTDSNLGGHALMICIEEVKSSDLQSTPKITVYANNMGSAYTENTALNDNTFSAINPESNFAPTLFQRVSYMKQKIEDRFQEPEDWTDELIEVGSPPQLVNDIGVCLHDNISQNSDSLKESFHFPSTEIHPRLHVKVYKKSSVSLVTDMAVEIKMVNAVEKLGAGIASKDSTLDESNHSLRFQPEDAHEMELLMDEPESRHLNKAEHSVISGSKDHVHEQKVLASKSLDSECVHGSLFLKKTLSEISLMHKSKVSENPALESKLLNEAEHHPKSLINASLGQNYVHELNHQQKTSVASHMYEPKFLVKGISDRDAVQDPELLLNKSNEPELVGKSKLLRTTAKSCPGHEPSLSLPDSFVDGNEVEYTKSEKLEIYSACASCGDTSSYSTGNTVVGQLLPENTPKIVITSKVNQNQLECEYSIHYNSNLASAVECNKKNCHISTRLTNSQNGANLEKLKLTVCDVDVESPKTYTSSKGEIKDFDVDNILPETRLVPSLFQPDYRAHKNIIWSNVVSDTNNIKYLYFAPKRSSACHSQQSSGSPEDQRNKNVKEFSTQKELVYYHPDLDRQDFKSQLCHENINIKNRQNISKTLQGQKELPRDKQGCLGEKSSDYFTASSEEYGHEEEDRMRHFHGAGLDVRIIPEKDDSRNTSKEVTVGRGFYKEYLTKQFHHVDRHTNLDSVHVIKAAGWENFPSVSTQKEDPSVTECKFLTGTKLKKNPVGIGSLELDVKNDGQQSVLYDGNLQTKLDQCVDTSNVVGDLSIASTDSTIHKADNLKTKNMDIFVKSTNGAVDVQTNVLEEMFTAEDSNSSQEGIGREEVLVNGVQFKEGHDLYDFSERVWGSSNDSSVYASEATYIRLGPSKNNYAHNDDIATNQDELHSLPYDEDSYSSEDEGSHSMKNRRIFRTTSQEDLTSTSVFHSFAYERGSKDRGQGNMKSHYIPPISSGKSYQKDTSSYLFHGCDPAAQGHLDFYQRYYWNCHFPGSLSEWEHWQREQHKAYQQWYSLRRCSQEMGQHPHRFENGTGVENLSSSLKQMSFESELYCEKSLTEEEEEFKTFKGHHSQNLYKEGSAKCICAEDEMCHAQIIPQVGDQRHAKTCDISKVDDELEASAVISMNNFQGTGKEQAEKARKSTQQIRKTHMDMPSSESENLPGKTTQKTEMHFRDESGIEEGDEIEPERYVRAIPSEALGLCTYCREWMQYWVWNNCRFPTGIQPSFCSISNTPTTIPHTPQCWNKITSSRTRSDQGPSPFGRERLGQEQWPHFNWDTGYQSCLYHGYKPVARSREERTISSYPYSCGDTWACTEQMDPTEHSISSRISTGPWNNQGMSSQTSSNMGVGHPLKSSNSFEGQWNYMEETSQIPNISTTISQDARNKDNDKNSSVLNLQRETKDGFSEHHCTISALSLGQMPDSKTFNIPHRVRDEFIDAELENQTKLIDNKQIKSLNAIDPSLNDMICAQVVSPHWLTEQYSSPLFGSGIDNVYSACESSISSEKTDIKSNCRPIKGRYSCMAGDVPSQDPVRNRDDLPISKGVMYGQGQSSVVEKAASPFTYHYSPAGMPSWNIPLYRQDEYEGFTVANTKDIETENSNSGCYKDSRDEARVSEDQSLYTTWSFPPPHFPYKADLSVRGSPSLNNPGYCFQQRAASSMNGQEIRLSSVTPCSNLPGFYPSDMQVSKPRAMLELSCASNFGDGTIFPHALGDTYEQNAESTGWSAHLQTDSRSVSETKVTSVPALGKQHSHSIWDYSTVSQDNYEPEAVEHAAIKLQSSHSTIVQPNCKVGNFGKELEEEEETSKTGEMPVSRYIPRLKRPCSGQSSSSDSSPVNTAGKSHRFSQHRKSSYSHLARKTDYFLAESSSISSRWDTDSDDSTEVDVSVASQESLIMPYYDPTRPPPVLPPFPASPFWGMYTSSEPSVPLRHDQMKSLSSRPEPGKTNSSDSEFVNVSHGGAIRKEDFRNSRFNPRSLMTAETVSDSPSIQRDWKTHYNTRVEGYGQTYIDSHCHLDFLFNRSGFKGTVARFKELNKHAFPKTYEGCVAVFCNPISFKPTGGLWMDVAAEKDVWLAFGCHPKMATDFTPWAEQSLQECLQHPKVVALGEIGLDYSGKFRQHEALQKDVFRRQLRIALEMSKPLVIHCRDAEEDCLRILREMVPSDYKIHCHCFTGYYENAKLWMEAFPNLYIGLTPLVTYNNAAPSHNLARFLPLSKLLLETDAPYFIPKQVPKKEVVFSHPGFAVTVAEEVARIKEIPVDIVLNAARINTRDMYGI